MLTKDLLEKYEHIFKNILETVKIIRMLFPDPVKTKSKNTLS